MRVQELALIIVASVVTLLPFRAASAVPGDAQERYSSIVSDYGSYDRALSSPLSQEEESALIGRMIKIANSSEVGNSDNIESPSQRTTNYSGSLNESVVRDIATDSPNGDFNIETDFPDVQIEPALESESTHTNSSFQKGIDNYLTEKATSLFESDSGLLGREGISGTLKTVMVMTVIVIAPAFLLMTTSYVRISVVLFLLRQALGAGQIPSNQVVATLAVFLTVLVMSPVGVEVYQKAIVPYSENQISRNEAFQTGQEPVRTFLWKQIERTGNTEMISLFTKYLPDVDEPKFYEDIPWRALAPAFLLSELKTAFLIGFQIFLPFLVIDFVVSCVLTSTGMMMLPPAIVSLPLKLALFVMVDGWTLIVKSLMESFA